MLNLTDPRFHYVPAVATDIRRTFARYCPLWADRMRGYLPPLPVASVTVHHAPKTATLNYTGTHR